MLGTPELEAIFQVRSYKSRTEGKHPPPGCCPHHLQCSPGDVWPQEEGLYFLLSSVQTGDLKQYLTSSCCLSKEEWKQGHSLSRPGTEGWPSEDSVSCLNWENAKGR